MYCVCPDSPNYGVATMWNAWNGHNLPRGGYDLPESVWKGTNNQRLSNKGGGFHLFQCKYPHNATVVRREDGTLDYPRVISLWCVKLHDYALEQSRLSIYFA